MGRIQDKEQSLDLGIMVGAADVRHDLCAVSDEGNKKGFELTKMKLDWLNDYLMIV